MNRGNLLLAAKSKMLKTRKFSWSMFFSASKILMSWIPRIPRSATLRPLLDFIKDTTDPYLNVFRRLLRPIGGPGGLAIDISPILAIFVLIIAQWIIVGAIRDL